MRAEPPSPGANVDPFEIDHFNADARRWWDPDGDFRTLHSINPLRLAYINEHAALAGTAALDVGCGGGLLAEAMATAGAQVTAIDMAPDVLAVAAEHAEQGGLEIAYRQSTAEDFAAAAPASFDVVTCLELLEHVPDPASVIAACARLVRPGGDVFFSTINRTPKAWLFAVVAAEHLLRLVPRGTHDYAKFLRPSEIERAARAAGLQLIDSTGLHYNPVTGQGWLAPGLDVNYLLHFRAEAGA